MGAQRKRVRKVTSRPSVGLGVAALQLAAAGEAFSLPPNEVGLTANQRKGVALHRRLQKDGLNTARILRRCSYAGDPSRLLLV